MKSDAEVIKLTVNLVRHYNGETFELHLSSWIAGYYEVVKMERGKKVCRKK